MLQGSHVCIADDEKNGRRMLEILISKLGYQVSVAANGQEALDIIRKNSINLLITDLKMPHMDGLQLLAALRAENNDIPVIVVTAHGTVESAVSAMKSGAFDFIMRPLDIEQIEMVVHKALETSRLKQENLFLRDQLKDGWDELVGHSQPMQAIHQLIRQVAPTKASVLISGETGTGKELVARAIHQYSGRKGLFVALNCAAIPVSMFESELFGYVRGAFTGANKDRIGKFEYAHQGTLFLDEITEMPLEIQAKLLRVLQENCVERLGSNRSFDVDIRFIAATNRDPRLAVAEKHLREDVFYRLNVFNISLPPLRERDYDILLLANNFIEHFRKQLGCQALSLSAAAAKILSAYAWPGNVRELKNIIERAVVLSRNGEIGTEHLPHELIPKQRQSDQTPETANNDRRADLEASVASLEVRMINQALHNADGNKAKAARQLKISERTLWYKLKKYHSDLDKT
ncbi:sigma-54 dependent transcriptional regulator [Methylomonas sp. AM2-LC]|uniref:sigma-54-dependent transcriptional regulator n=1 Tax=Methylomonas sp. AM2-LC TaxID=3153301 RepID=UPI00326712DE